MYTLPFIPNVMVDVHILMTVSIVRDGRTDVHVVQFVKLDCDTTARLVDGTYDGIIIIIIRRYIEFVSRRYVYICLYTANYIMFVHLLFLFLDIQHTLSCGSEKNRWVAVRSVHHRSHV